MKRILLIGLILLGTIGLTACSYSIHFVVINKSASTIEVKYTFKRQPASLENTEFQPSRMSLSDWNSWFSDKNDKWIKLSQAEYDFDSENHKCKIMLAPNEALKILSAHDSIYFVEKYEDFEIVNIKLTGENGTIVFEGNQLFKQFGEKNYSNRFITYK